jgi:hypothetical protein
MFPYQGRFHQTAFREIPPRLSKRFPKTAESQVIVRLPAEVELLAPAPVRVVKQFLYSRFLEQNIWGFRNRLVTDTGAVVNRQIVVRWPHDR